MIELSYEFHTQLTVSSGWKHSLSKWNEFLADDLANSLDAPQEFFVQVWFLWLHVIFNYVIRIEHALLRYLRLAQLWAQKRSLIPHYMYKTDRF